MIHYRKLVARLFLFDAVSFVSQRVTNGLRTGIYSLVWRERS